MPADPTHCPARSRVHTSRATRFVSVAFSLLALAPLLVCAAGCGRQPGSEKDSAVKAPVARIGDVPLTLHIVRRHAGRTELLPEQRAGFRPIAEETARRGDSSAVLFAYSTDDNRSVHVDADPRDRTTELAFLKADGTVDSVHRLAPKEVVALSDGPIRFALFLTDGGFDRLQLAPGTHVALPTGAADGAEPEFTRITDPDPTPITIAGKSLTVEVAWRNETRARGLMYRSYIPDDTGMLFIFRDPKQQNFWMRNTRASLDIAYIDENNRVRNILTMRAHDLDSSGQYRSDGPVVMALETRAGWFRENGVKRGATIVLPDSIATLRTKADP